MGYLDSPDICELDGTYIQCKLTNKKNKEDVGLYRNDDLGAHKNISGAEKERKKKAIVEGFKKCGISSAVDTNLRTNKFLDATFRFVKKSMQNLDKAE